MAEKHKSKIPYEMLGEILKAYEHGRKEDLELYENDYIMCPDNIIWANWTEIYEIRDKIKVL